MPRSWFAIQRVIDQALRRAYGCCVSAGHDHAWINRIQTLLLILTLLGLAAVAGWLLFGSSGLWMALGAAVVALALEPGAASWLTLRLYHAQPLPPNS
ncbi:MAG: hypothetical protein ACUVT2_10870, partial [Thiobacillaceae bacterium]